MTAIWQILIAWVLVSVPTALTAGWFLRTRVAVDRAVG